MIREVKLQPGDVTRIRAGVPLIEDRVFVTRGGLEVVVIAAVDDRYQVEDVYKRQWCVWPDDLEVRA